MILTSEDIAKEEKVRRLNLINSITGIKPANLLGTVDKKNQSNLAIFSSVVHLGSFPPLLGFVMRPNTEVRRHTYENMMENDGYYTINHVHPDFMGQAHYTSAKFEKDESEFEFCNFNEEYIEGFAAPFVKESSIKIGMKFVEELPIKINGTILMIGEVKLISIPDEILDDHFQVDLSTTSSGISGLNRYYSLQKQAEFPYARRQKVPDFK